MKLPHVEQAIIPQQKLTEYLLSPTHRTGRSKAVFFVAFGFTREAWGALADMLRRHAEEHDVSYGLLVGGGRMFAWPDVFIFNPI